MIYFNMETSACPNCGKKTLESYPAADICSNEDCGYDYNYWGAN
jgi:hypothetical protein